MRQRRSGPLVKIILAASGDLDHAIELYENDSGSFGEIMEHVYRASGLLQGSALILEDRDEETINRDHRLTDGSGDS